MTAQPHSNLCARADVSFMRRFFAYVQRVSCSYEHSSQARSVFFACGNLHYIFDFARYRLSAAAGFSICAVTGMGMRISVSKCTAEKVQRERSKE